MDCIQTRRLRLRRATMSDVEDMHRVLSHPVAMRYWSRLPHRTVAQTAEWLSSMIAASDSCDDFLIERDGRVIGKLGCWRLPEIGFILHPEHWRQGLASEALDAVIPQIFARHPIDALTADVDPRNIACLRLLENHGFIVVGSAKATFQLGEDWCDSLYLARSRDHGRRSPL